MLIKCVQKIAQCNSLKYFSISTQRKLRLKFHMRETFLFGLIKRIAELVSTKTKKTVYQMQPPNTRSTPINPRTEHGYISAQHQARNSLLISSECFLFLYTNSDSAKFAEYRLKANMEKTIFFNHFGRFITF